MDKIKISVNESSSIGINISNKNLKVNVNKQSIDINVDTPNLIVSAKEKYNLLVRGKHNDLENLDYEHSGHIGFASEKQLNLLGQTTIQKDLSILPNYDMKANRSTAYLYIDNNGVSQKVSAKTLLSTLVRTSEEIPNDLQDGEYVFLRKE